MTPLHLDILKHYHISSIDYPELITCKTRLDYAYDLAKRGLLFTPKIEPRPNPLFEITDYGTRKMEQILELLAKES